MANWDEYMDALCVGLDNDIIPFAKRLFKEVGYLDKSAARHTIPIARRVVAYNEFNLNEMEMAKAIIVTYNDFYYEALSKFNDCDPTKVDIEAEALVIMVNKVMKDWHLYKGYKDDLLTEFDSISD